MSRATALSGRQPFHVRLPVFEGPIELLLQILNLRRLDVSLVSLSAITGDYIEQIQGTTVDPAELGNFLQLATRLVLLKSRLLLPNSSATEPDDETEDDQDLVRRVQQYQAFKASASFLAEQIRQQLTWYPRQATVPTRQVLGDPFDGIELGQLRLLAFKVAAVRSQAPLPPVDLAQSWVSLHECLDTIAARLASAHVLTFADLLRDTSTPDSVVGMFLGVLHLWKQSRIEVAQEAPFAELFIRSC